MLDSAEQKKISNLCTCYNSVPNDRILDLSKLKAFADEKINMVQKSKIFYGSVESIVE